MEIKKILQDIMYEHRLNQLQLANKLGVSPSQVSQWLEGKNYPGYAKLKLICEQFDIDANILLGTTKKGKKSSKE